MILFNYSTIVNLSSYVLCKLYFNLNYILKMSKQKVEEIFNQNESIIVNKIREILDLKKSVFDLKSKVRIYEDHKRKLIDYIKFSETIIRNCNRVKLALPNITNSIEETQQLIINIKKDIAVMESKNEIESNEKLVMNMKKVLAALYEDKFDSLIKKEKILTKLKNKTKEYENSKIFKEKQAQLENYNKEYDLLKAKNMHLKEMITMNIEKKI